MLEIESEQSREIAPILLGRPFLMIAHSKIDVFRGTLSMEIDGEMIYFNIFKVMQHPFKEASMHALDTIDDLGVDMRNHCCK